MSRLPTYLSAWLAAITLAQDAEADAPDTSPRQIRAAVERALPLIQESAATWRTAKDCFSCHHQGPSVMAMTVAREKGFDVDADDIQEQLSYTRRYLNRGRDNYRQGRGGPGGITEAGYALWALALGGGTPDETTAAVAEYLLLGDQHADHWYSGQVGSNRIFIPRPPSEASHFTATFVALTGLQGFGTPEQKEQTVTRVERARGWLLRTPAEETEDRVFRLWGLRAASAGDAAVRAAAAELVRAQRDDGGWAQVEGTNSDAYATGSALVALHRAGGMPPGDAAYRRGVAYLVRTQEDDGSWHVTSRARPFQPYFESGFPHGKDQFISMAASGWAATALALACPEPAERATLRGHTRDASYVAFSPDGRLLASAGADGMIKLWDPESGRELATLRGHNRPVTSLAFSPDGGRLASADWDGKVKLWDVAARREQSGFDGDEVGVTCVAFSPDGKSLAFSGFSRGVQLWDVAASRVHKAFGGPREFHPSLAFSPDGRSLATADEHGVKRYDVTTGREQGTFKGLKKVIFSLAFSPDGQSLALGGGDEPYEPSAPGGVTLWDVARGRERATLRGHATMVYSVGFSPDGRVLASASYDGVLRLWDAATGRERAHIRGHEEPVIHLAFSPDGRTLATASLDRTVKLWDVERMLAMSLAK